MTNPAGGLEHLFIEGVHQYHVCQHDSCIENRKFNRLLDEKGSDYVAQRIMKRAEYRLYDRRYPYDSTATAIQLEDVQDSIGVESEHLDGIIAGESLEQFKEMLTPTQRTIADLLEMGYEPMQIAELQGKTTSNSIRWHKHMIKKKAEGWYEE